MPPSKKKSVPFEDEMTSAPAAGHEMKFAKGKKKPAKGKGKKLVVMKCGECGARLKKSDKVCPKCGAKC